MVRILIRVTQGVEQTISFPLIVYVYLQPGMVNKYLKKLDSV